MKKLVLGLIITSILVGVGFLVERSGLRRYVNALMIVNSFKTVEQRKKGKIDFFANDKSFTYGGILAGTWQGKIGVWGQSGLKLFTTDQYSVIDYFDGCSASIIDKIASEEIKTPSESLFFNFNTDKWQKIVKAGDYVVVQTTIKGQGGTVGNLRQMYEYNYWPFIQKDIKTECAR
jgi:hypothetical protein